MTETMMKEIVEDWQSWKYDIIELNNSTWTQRDEAQKSTVVVAVFTIIFAIAVFAVDYVFQLGLDNFFTMFNN